MVLGFASDHRAQLDFCSARQWERRCGTDVMAQPTLGYELLLVLLTAVRYLYIAISWNISE